MSNYNTKIAYCQTKKRIATNISVSDYPLIRANYLYNIYYTTILSNCQVF